MVDGMAEAGRKINVNNILDILTGFIGWFYSTLRYTLKEQLFDLDYLTDITNPAVTIKEWVIKHTDSMYSWAFYKTGRKEIAEDLVQDTFLDACQSLAKFKGNSEPQTWLFAILNNKIADHYRNACRNPSAPLATEGQGSSFLDHFFDEEGQWKPEQRPQPWLADAPHLLDDTAFMQVLQECMNRLPATWLSAVHLKYIDARKGEWICQELQIAPTNFWQILHRAKLQLRKCLELHWFKNER